MILIILFSFLFANDTPAPELDLVEPIAKSRSDGYELPKSSFTDTSGVESWFIKEKGFVAESDKVKKKQRQPSSKKKKLPMKKKTSKKRVKRDPASSKREILERKKKQRSKIRRSKRK